MQQTQSHRDNIVWQAKLQATMLKTHGVTNPGQMDDHVQVTAQTLMKRHGVSNALNLPHARERMKEALASPEVIIKRKETNITRYGHENPFGSTTVQQTIKETLLEKHGVEHSSLIPGIGEKRKQTYRERTGYEHPFKTPASLAKLRSPATNIKRHETMKRNDTYGKSTVEDTAYETLLQTFPNTQRQVNINGWAIDFYVPEVDTYVQLDGVYWHGLDRPRSIIEASQSPRDKVILSTLIRDKQQNIWFAAHDLKLVRFTDQQQIADVINNLYTLSQK